jgi:signal transduction histidine kinase
LQFLEGASKIDYIIDIKQPFPLFSDASRITVLLNNLISNAIKYHNYEQEHSYIKISILGLYDHVIISIKDNGKGLKEEHIRKIFNMFYVVAENNAGTGIGLYIVKETIEKMGGKIRVESEYGKGSNFIMEIPNQQLSVNENKQIQYSVTY